MQSGLNTWYRKVRKREYANSGLIANDTIHGGFRTDPRSNSQSTPNEFVVSLMAPLKNALLRELAAMPFSLSLLARAFFQFRMFDDLHILSE